MAQELPGASDNPVQLTQLLTRIDSTNTTLSSIPGLGEAEIAQYIESWLQRRGIETHRLEQEAGRPSIVGVVRGTGGGRSLMINGHIDTVSTTNYVAEPLSGALETRDGKQVVFGRGSLDMKAGIAAGMAALLYAAKHPPKGDVILAAVADEEHLSKGTQEVLQAGWRADGAVITEPTQLQLGVAHKGFTWVDIDILGVGAHGSDPKSGVDAIMKAGVFMRSLDEYSKGLPVDDDLGNATLHCGLISGGEEPSTYPAKCSITIEFRTIPSQSPESIEKDLRDILKAIAAEDKHFKFSTPQTTFHRPPYKILATHEFTKACHRAARSAVSGDVPLWCFPAWCDAALLGEAGIPSIVFGPAGEGLHAKEEWVEVESIRQTTQMLQNLIDEFCN